MNIHTQLYRARVHQGLSQQNVGERIGATTAQVSSWELGAGITLTSLEKWAKALGYRLALEPLSPQKAVSPVLEEEWSNV